MFCNENSYIPNMGRRPVDMVIDELNFLDEKYGPVGSVVIHDSMFFQNPSWLEEWIDKYPRRANKLWPYWAAARADTVRQWPDLFEALIRETNWNTVSIGFESGSDRVLRMLNKECTEEDNYFTIDLLDRIGDDLDRQGKPAPVFWSNIMLGIPGETRDDAFKTMRMVKYMRRVMPSICVLCPLPRLGAGQPAHRRRQEPDVEGKLPPLPRRREGEGHRLQVLSRAAGRQVRQRSQPRPQGAPPRARKSAGRSDEGLIAMSSFSNPHYMYLFTLKNGKKRLAYGQSPEDALEILSFRLAPEEMAEIRRDEYVKINQRKLQDYIHELG